jgi:hypothetical protein
MPGSSSRVNHPFKVATLDVAHSSGRHGRTFHCKQDAPVTQIFPKNSSRSIDGLPAFQPVREYSVSFYRETAQGQAFMLVWKKFSE